MLFCRLASVVLIVHCAAFHLGAQELLVEAESFSNHGGWRLDTQFIENMGSPYLLAHGLGKPVADAHVDVRFPATGKYHVFVRTMDWVARWKAPGTPGRFKLQVGDHTLDTEFGTKSAAWFWHPGGTVDIDNLVTSIQLKDLTGFDGRCDAIYFSRTDAPPPNDSAVLADWRRRLLGLSETPIERDYDLVVVGGGYSGVATALSAARMGCRVALIQNRPVLGGNGSSEVRVWSMGHVRRGRYPRIGEIVEEFCDHATKSPGSYEEFEDAKKEAIVRAERNIDLFLNHHGYRVDTDDSQVTAVYALDTRTNQRARFTGKYFADCTGHGTIGFLADADWEMTPQGRMGMSNMWAWNEGKSEVEFPETPWALDLEMKDFPYPRDHHGQWFWEGGFDKDPIKDAEAIRDWNLRAVFGAFNAMKNRDGADKHQTAFLTWVAFIGGPRESRRLMGDVVLTADDIVSKRDFPDGCVPSTWSIDLHYPKKQFAEKFPDNPFISIAVHDRRIDRSYGYPIPYRCFYSRNVDNLFMAGRNISVTHEALGTTRVMRTCGMMGEVAGKAASLCVLHDCTPRQVYADHLSELIDLLKLPGKAYRDTPKDAIVIPDDILPLASAYGPITGVDPATLAGLVVDDHAAAKEGSWTSGTGLKGYVGNNYLYAAKDSKARIDFRFKTPEDGIFDIRIAYQPHENRASHAPVEITTPIVKKTITVDMRDKPPLENGFLTVGRFTLSKGDEVAVSLSTQGAGGYVHADAVQAVRVD